MGNLILIRHGESEWNASGRFAGTADISLTTKGRQQARDIARHLPRLKLNAVYASELKRAKQTLHEIVTTRGLSGVSIVTAGALNERDYGNFTGQLKTEIISKIGENGYAQLRNRWDYKPPAGESLEMLSDRVVNFFESRIMPDLKKDYNVLVVSHNNTLRVLILHLRKLPPTKIQTIQLGNGEIVSFSFEKTL